MCLVHASVSDLPSVTTALAALLGQDVTPPKTQVGTQIHMLDLNPPHLQVGLEPTIPDLGDLNPLSFN